jgi:hypothetical protein
MAYETPVIKDHGTLAQLTLFTGLFGTEDGASKAIPFHHNPSSPGTP